MIRLNVLFEIIKQYKLTYLERVLTKLTYRSYLNKVKNTFENHDKIDNLLKEEIDSYLQDSHYELELLNFIMKNRNKIWVTDIYRTMDKFDKNYEERYIYLEDLFCKLQTAIDMKLDYKFYAPQKKPKYLTDEDVQSYIEYVKGFSIDRVKEFLIEEKILKEEEILEILKDAKILNVDSKENKDIFGVFDNALVLPKVKDEISSLITIHELVRIALIKNREVISDDEITFSEDLPIFYELLFKEINEFIDIDIHKSLKSMIILENYHDEPFQEQVSKLKKIKQLKR